MAPKSTPKPKVTPKGQPSIASFFGGGARTKPSPSALAAAPSPAAERAPVALEPSLSPVPISKRGREHDADAEAGSSALAPPAVKRACIDLTVEPSPLNPKAVADDADTPEAAADFASAPSQPMATGNSNASAEIAAASPPGTAQRPAPAARPSKPAAIANRDALIPPRAPKRQYLARHKLVERYERDTADGHSKGTATVSGGGADAGAARAEKEGPLSFAAAAALAAASAGARGKSRFTPLELQVIPP